MPAFNPSAPELLRSLRLKLGISLLRYCCWLSAAGLIFTSVVGAQTFERSETVDIYGENSVREVLKTRFEAAAVAYQERPLISDWGTFGTSLVVDNQAEFPNPAFPTNSQTPSFNDFSSKFSLLVIAPLSTSIRPSNQALDFGVQAAAAFAEQVALEGAPLRVITAFTADEYVRLDSSDQSGGPNGLCGLRDLLSVVETAERTVVIYLDLPGQNPQPALLQGSARTLTPLAIAASLRDTFRDQGLKLRAVSPFMELYRIGLVNDHPALSLLNQAAYQALLFQPDHRRQSEAQPSPQEFATGLYAFAQRLPDLPAVSERAYVLLDLGFTEIRFSESLIVFLFIVGIVLTMTTLFIYAQQHPRAMRARLKAFIRRSWALPIYLLLFSLIFYLAGYLLRWLISLKARAFDINSGELAFIRLLLSGAFYSLISPWIVRYPFPRRAHFYGAAAVILLALGTVALAFLDITFVPALLWALLFALAAAATRWRWLTGLLALLSPLPLSLAALTAGFSGNPSLANWLLADDWRSILGFAFLILPFFLLFRRILILSQNHRDRRGENWYSRLVVALAAILITTNSLIRYNHPDTARTASLEQLTAEAASARLGGQEAFNLKVEETVFLDRLNLHLSLEPTGRPERLDLSLSFESPSAIYDAPVPYSYGTGQTGVDFVLGERPPLPLELELIVPAGSRGRLMAKAHYLNPPWATSQLTGNELNGTDNTASSYRVEISAETSFGLKP